MNGTVLFSNVTRIVGYVDKSLCKKRIEQVL